jgi:hypothetical protein
MRLRIDARGQVRCLYGEAIDLAELGALTIRRAGRVEPDPEGRWWAELCALGGPRLGPYPRRSAVLAAEAAWVEARLFAAGPGPS